MRFLRVLMQSSVLRCSTFFLAAIVLVPFDTPKTALAERRPPTPPGQIPSMPGPDKNDCPDDDEIMANFLGTKPDGTDPDQISMAVDCPRSPQESVKAFSTQYGLKYLTISYTEGFLPQGQRSDRWYTDFYIRCILYWLKEARGWVYVISNANGPRIDQIVGCAIWFRWQFPALKANTAVLGIVIVNIDNFQDLWLYWAKGDGEAPRRRPSPNGDGNGNGRNGNGNNGNGNGNGPSYGNGGSVMNAGAMVGTSVGAWLKTGAVGASAALSGAWRALTEHPFASTGDDTKNPKDQPKGVETDVLPNSHAELPDLPVGIDQNPIKVGVLNSNIGELSNVPIGIGQYPTDVAATGSTSPDDQSFDLGGGLIPYATWRNSNPARSLKLFGRGRREMQSRAMPDACSEYYIDGDSDPDNPSYNIMPGQVDIKISASSWGPVYPWADGDRASLTITQYKRSLDSPGQPYNLDINILDANGNPLVAQQRVVASPSQELEIDSQGRLLLSLWVKVDEVKDNPISFRYGDPPITGTDWNSDEVKDHGCVTDPKGDWDDSRKIMCLFKV